MSSSATRRVLATLELLSVIFEFSEKNFTNAFVCKIWSHEALNVIWCAVDFENLLSLLVPTMFVGDGHVFSSPLSPADLERFCKYSSRVQSLVVSYPSENHARSLFADIVSIRPQRELFPNLRILCYRGGPAAFLPMFFQDNLREVVLETGADEPEDSILDSLLRTSHPSPHRDIALALRYLPIFAPKLRHLALRGNFPYRSLRTTWNTMFSTAFSELTSLHLPSRFLDPSLTCNIASLPLLETLAYHSSKCFGSIAGADFQNAFPALRHLFVSTSLNHVAEFLHRQQRHLVSLNVVAPRKESSFQYVHMLIAIGCCCPNLENLEISLLGMNATTSKHPLPLASLEPILHVNLKVLRLPYYIPFELDSDDFVTIVESLPSLTSLQLNNCLPKAPRVLDLSVLLRMLPHCNKLEELRLQLDAQSLPPIITTKRTFPKLKRLDLGRSPVNEDSTVPIAMFLSGILPKACQLPVRGTANGWAKVNSLLPALIEVRQQERKMS